MAGGGTGRNRGVLLDLFVLGRRVRPARRIEVFPAWGRGRSSLVEKTASVPRGQGHSSTVDEEVAFALERSTDPVR